MSKRRLSEFFQNLPNLDIGGADYAVLCELARRENEETGLCCPSVETLATFTHFNVRSVQRSIHSLARKGILTITSRRDDKNRMTSHSFSFNLINPKPPKDDPYPVKLSPLKGGKLSPSRGDRMSPSSPDNVSPSSAPTKCHPNNTTRSLNNPNVNNQTQNNTTPNPIQSHSPRAHAKDGIGLGGGCGVGRGASLRSKRTAGDMPILSSLDTKGMPKGYPDEEKYLAFIESLLTDEGQNWRRSVLMEGRKSFQRICDRGWQDKDGGFIGNWRRYARGCIAKEFEEVAHRILNWDDALISVADVEPPEMAGLKPYNHPSEPAEQPQKSLPPPTKERKPDPKPEQPPMEIPAVEPQPPSKPHVSPFDADPVLAQQLKVHQMIRERKEAERRRLMGLPV